MFHLFPSNQNRLRSASRPSPPTRGSHQSPSPHSASPGSLISSPILPPPSRLKNSRKNRKKFTPFPSAIPSSFCFDHYSTLDPWHAYPRPLISRSPPPTRADNNDKATKTTTTTTSMTTTVTAHVYESAALTTSTSTSQLAAPSPRTNNPQCRPRARATPPGCPSVPRPPHQARPSTRSAPT